MKNKKLLTFFILVLIWLATGFMKTRIYQKGTNFIKGGDFCLFRVEEATRYRYAKLISEGKKIPKIDYSIQYPEGLKVYKHFTITSEIIIGLFYRFLPLKKVPFHAFLVIFMFFFSSLAIFSVYLVVSFLSKSRLAGIISALFYATAFPSFARTIAGGMVEEDFALCLIFFSFYFFIRGVKEKKLSLPILAGIFLFVPLTSWHVTQFYFTLLVVYVIGEFFIKKETFFFMRNFLILVLFNFLAGLIIPVLKGGNFIFSYSMILSYGLILTHYLLKKKKKWIKFPAFVVLVAIFILIVSPYVSKHRQDYTHVYSLVFNKIKYLGQKPAYSEVVEKLPFDTKVMWQSSFVSPTTKDLKNQFLFVFLFSAYGVVSLILRFLKKKTSIEEEGNLYFLLVFFILYLLIERMYVFEIFFLAAAAGFSTKKALEEFSCRKWVGYGLLAVIGLLLFVQARGSISTISRGGIAHRIKPHGQKAIKWIKENTPADAVVLADIGISPEIVAFSGRKSIIHNHYEAKDIRLKTEEYYKNLFENEDKFYEFSKKYGATHILHSWEHILNFSRDSVRYQVNAYRVYKDAVAYLFNYKPGKLKHFSLLYQNNYYRIFEVVKPQEKPKPVPKLNYVPFFNEKTFQDSYREIVIEGDERGPVFDDDYAQNKMKKVWDMPNILSRGNSYRSRGMYEEARKEYQRNVEIDPYMPQARLTTGEFLVSQEDYGNAIGHLEKAIELNPALTQAYYLLGIAYNNYGDTKKAIIILKKGLKIEPENERLKEVLNKIR